jgi:SAM-dependent methyltransferase
MFFKKRDTLPGGDHRLGIRTSVDVPLETSAAFDATVEELTRALLRFGIRIDPMPGGRVTEDGVEIGRVVSWLQGDKIVLDWVTAEWAPEGITKTELRFEPTTRGTRVTLEQSEWGHLLDDGKGELIGWFAYQVAAPLLNAIGPTGFGDWLTDRRARKPSGAKARESYRNPVYHLPNFLAILRVLSLSSNDYLLEVGCGGGAFLQQALKSGCRAAAVDHSSDMVRVAREVNEEVIKQHRLEVLEAEAERLPYPDATFTCAVMTGVFFFLPDPAKILTEMNRVLRAGGRLAIFTESSELRGTIAAPEPMASRMQFYEDTQLEILARAAGFKEARVERPELMEFARQAGVPAEDVGLFSGKSGQLLLARKG